MTERFQPIDRAHRGAASDALALLGARAPYERRVRKGPRPSSCWRPWIEDAARPFAIAMPELMADQAVFRQLALDLLAALNLADQLDNLIGGELRARSEPDEEMSAEVRTPMGAPIEAAADQESSRRSREATPPP